MSKVIRPTLLVNILLQTIILLSLPGATFSQRRSRRLSPPPAPQPEPIALVTQLRGDVKWQNSGGRSAKTITITTFIYAGDKIITGPDGAGVIYQIYAPFDRLKPNNTKTIARLSPPPPAGALKPEEFAWFKRQYASALRNQNNLSPATQGGPDDQTLTLVSPRHSVAIEDHPTFEWAGIKDATKYIINLYDKNENIVWTAETAEARIKYPDDEKHKALPPGDYKWDVTARVGNQITSNPALYDAAPFTIATRQQADSILQDLKRAQSTTPGGETTNVIYIGALIEHKLYPAAEIELRKALINASQDQALWALLMETYNSMKRWEAREKTRRLIISPNQIELIRAFLQEGK